MGRKATTPKGQWVFSIVRLLVVVAAFAAMSSGVFAAPYADYVIDARTGEVLHEKNSDTRLHPASLTKMMTLYIAFEAIERGEISLDTKVTVSKHAASQPPSRLGLKPGQKIALRYLIRAAAIKSANDAATAIGEAIEGSEPAFAKRMTRTARALGMSKTTFRNANGLTTEGHLSTAHDMTILGRQLFYDFPQYYNLFSRRSADAGIAKVASTNRRFLDAYKGADGIKTGYTVAAGFNLVASAERGGKRIIATVFGGTSTAQRNDRVAQLLDIGFGKAPNRAVVQKPASPNYAVAEGGTFAVGGGRSPRFDRGYFIDPTLVVGLDNSARVAREEIFGPVLVVIAHDGDDDAVAIANDSPYGLSGAVCSGDEDRALAVAARIRTGTLGINGGIWYGADVPFGGYKQSGIGREMGVAGFEEYLETKAIAVAR